MKKIFKYTFISALSVILLLLIAPFIFKQKLIDASKEFINEQLVADVNFDEDLTSLSFLKSFPNVSLTLANISIVGRDSFAGDTLAFLPFFTTTFNIKSVFSDQINVSRLALKEPEIRAKVLRDGKPNWEIWQTDTTRVDTAETTFALNLQGVEIENGRLAYTDYSMGFLTVINGLNYEGKGDFTQDEFILQNDLHASELTLEYGGIPWVYKAVIQTKISMGMNIPLVKINWDSDEIQVNNLRLHSDGFVQMNEKEMEMDLRFNAMENTFKNFLSMVPGIYQNDFENLKAEGTMGLKGSMVGKMTDDHLPKTDIQLNINNGSFSYPDLPRNVKDVFIDLSYVNSNGIPDNTILNISNLKANIGGDLVDGRLLFKTPISNPYVDAELKGDIDLGNMKGFIPLEEGTVLEGIIGLNTQVKGYVQPSDNYYQDLDAKGFLKANNVKFSSYSDPVGVILKTVNFSISPRYATVENAQGNLGRNDFEMNGRVDNYLAYLFAGETLKGNLDLKSRYLNANDFMSANEAQNTDPLPSDSNTLSMIVLPENIDWKMSADVQKLIYDNFVLENVKGNLHVVDAAIKFENVAASLAGGSILLDGVYDSKNIQSPFTELNTSLTKFDIKKSFEYFPFMREFSNLGKVANGIFDGKIEMSSTLDEGMQPHYNSMNMNADLSISDAVITKLDVLTKIGEVLKIDPLKNIELKNGSIRFKISNGVLRTLDSVKLNLGKGAMMKLSGSSNLNTSIDYGGRISIPRELFGKSNDVLSSWKNLAAAKNWDLEMAKTIPVDLGITGTFLKPDVKVSLHSIKNSVLDPLKTQVIEKAKEEGNKKIEAYLAKAQIKADQLKSEAKRRADQIRSVGKKSADSIRKVTAKETDKLRKEAKERSLNLKKEGDLEKERIIAKANKEVDDLLAQAAGKGPIASMASKKAGEKIKEKAALEASKIKKKYDRRVDDINKKANSQISEVQNQGNKKATQIEEESSKKGDKLESEAKVKADKIMDEAREKSKL